MRQFVKVIKVNKVDGAPKWRRLNAVQRHFRRAIRLPRRLLWALFMEGVETKEMIQTYAKHGRGKLLVRMAHDMPTEEEMRKAKEQLRDLPKFLPFFVLVVVPLPGVTEGYALVAITIENWLGSKVNLLPSQFRKVFEKEEESGL